MELSYHLTDYLGAEQLHDPQFPDHVMSPAGCHLLPTLSSPTHQCLPISHLQVGLCQHVHGVINYISLPSCIWKLLDSLTFHIVLL